MSKLEYFFKVGNKNYVFDGEVIDIIKISNNQKKYIRPVIQKTNKVNGHKSSYIRTLALNLTNNCNLKCKYCFANQGKYDKPFENMSFNTAKKSIDMLISTVLSHDGKDMSIAFFGGEPLLRFDLIKDIVSYVQKKSNNIFVKYFITTNGTLMNEEICDFMKKNSFMVTVSIDGNKSENDRYRVFNDGKGSYEKVRESILYYKKISPKLVVRSTITDANSNIYKVVEHFLSIGIKNITYALDYSITIMVP